MVAGFGVQVWTTLAESKWTIPYTLKTMNGSVSVQTFTSMNSLAAASLSREWPPHVRNGQRLSKAVSEPRRMDLIM